MYNTINFDRFIVPSSIVMCTCPLYVCTPPSSGIFQREILSRAFFSSFCKHNQRRKEKRRKIYVYIYIYISYTIESKCLIATRNRVQVHAHRVTRRICTDKDRTHNIRIKRYKIRLWNIHGAPVTFILSLSFSLAQAQSYLHLALSHSLALYSHIRIQRHRTFYSSFSLSLSVSLSLSHSLSLSLCSFQRIITSAVWYLYPRSLSFATRVKCGRFVQVK